MVSAGQEHGPHVWKWQNHHMPLPKPPLEESGQLLQAIWGITVATLKWPTFAELDSRWDSEYETDVADILRDLPEGFVCGFDRRMPAQDTTAIGLTVAGAAVFQDTLAQEALLIFLDFLRVATGVQKGWQPPTGNPGARPSLTDTEYVNQAKGLPAAGRRDLLQLLFLLLRNETSIWSGLSGPDAEGHWQVTFDRRIRAFRGVTDLDDYWDRRHKPWESHPESPTTAIQETVGDEQGGNVTEIPQHTPKFLTPTSAGSPMSAASTAHPSPNAPIFIVHGSDTTRAQLVARAVEKATGRDAIILREQAHGGRTLIEKFEAHAQEASYAIVLLTADDEGGRNNETSRHPRARQNVIFEMGYFYGLIGRSRVSVLLDPSVEQPSDMNGIAYINFDDDDRWKRELFREIQNSGFSIAWDRIP